MYTFACDLFIVVSLKQTLALMERFDLQVQTVFREGELKYVLNSHGQLFVTHTGTMKMQVCCAGSLDFLLMVDNVYMLRKHIH